MNYKNLDIQLFFQEDLGNLLEVKYISDEDSRENPSAILMYFSKTVIMVRVVAEYDSVETIILDFDRANNLDSIDVSTNFLWRDSINAKLQWVWGLTNQQGYTDGVQFEWMKSHTNKSVLIQAIAAASCFKLYKVEEVL